MKEPVSQAVADIKVLHLRLFPVLSDLLKFYKISDVCIISFQADITRSLHSRLDIICDEAEQDLNPPDVGDDEEAEILTIPISKSILNSST